MIGRPSVLIVDDHALFREVLLDYLERRACCEETRAVGDLESAAQALRQMRNTLVLLDISLRDESGIIGIPRLRSAAGRRKVRVLVLSMHTRTAVVRAALDAGADGYLTKDAAGDELLAAISEIGAGRRYIDPAVEPRLASESGARDRETVTERYTRLTRREQEIFVRLAHGEKPAQIARVLNISPKTADVHRYNIFKKLSLDSIVDLVRVAMEIGIL